MLIHGNKPQVFGLFNLHSRQKRMSSNFIIAINGLLQEFLNPSQKPPPLLIQFLTKLTEVCQNQAFSHERKQAFCRKQIKSSSENLNKQISLNLLANKRLKTVLFILGIISKSFLISLISKVINNYMKNIPDSNCQNPKQSKASLMKVFMSGLLGVVEKVRLAVGSAEEIMSNVEWLILIVYMLGWDKHFTFIETLLGINYVYTYKNDRIRDVSYAVEGYLLLITLLFKGFKRFPHIFNSKNSQNQPQKFMQLLGFSKKQNTDSKQDLKENLNCRLCLGIIHNKSSTKCGHIFCWSCIIKSLQNSPHCPVCQNNCMPQQVVRLKNF